MSEMQQVMARFADMQAGWGVDTTPQKISADVEDLYVGFAQPCGAVIEQVDVQGMPSEWIVPLEQSPIAVLHLHGGGFSTGTPRGYRGLACAIGTAATANVLTLNYRLVPDHVFPAQLDDAVAGYDWLLAKGFAPSQIAITGDSAGGGLAVSLLLKLRELGNPLPSCAALLSPWADVACEGESYTKNAGKDPIATHDMARGMGEGYLGGRTPATDPLASPIHADLSGLPPLLVLVGGCEIFESDGLGLLKNAERDGVKAELLYEEDMVHVWPLFASVLTKGKSAIQHIGRFISAHAGRGAE